CPFPLIRIAMTDSATGTVAVSWLVPGLQQAASELAGRLGLPLQAPDDATAEMLLQLGEDGLSLRATAEDAPGAIRVDFVEDALAHRRQYGGGAGQMVARAVGIRGALRPRVLDATAGLGRDAFVLASLGCDVVLIERQPVIAALLADGLERARHAGGEVAEIAGRMQLLAGDAIELMADWSEPAPEVIHLDPMFPERQKSALVKKEMRLFRPLAGDDADSPQLL